MDYTYNGVDITMTTNGDFEAHVNGVRITKPSMKAMKKHLDVSTTPDRDAMRLVWGRLKVVKVEKFDPFKRVGTLKKGPHETGQRETASNLLEVNAELMAEVEAINTKWSLKHDALNNQMRANNEWKTRAVNELVGEKSTPFKG
jgi:hypothetical protein